jgi:hypothetical protein
MSIKSLTFAALALSAVLAVGGCKKAAPAEPAQVPNSDGLTSQAAPPPANAPTTAAAPAAAPASPAAAPAAPGTAPASDVAPGSAMQGPPPPASSEAAAVPPPPPQKLTAPVGTPVTVTITEQLSASHNEVGDRFTGVLAESVRSSGGGTMFPRGTRVAGTVIASKGRGRFKGAGALGIELTSIAGMPVSVTEYEKQQAGKGKRTAGFIGGGAGGGALIGGLAGGGKGALIGGLLGGGAGTAGAAFTGNKDVVIQSESRVTFRLRSPVTITVQPK